MNIVFLFLSFNGIGDDRGMYGDLVCEFAKRGYNVYIIAPSKDKRTYIEHKNNIYIKWVKSLSLINVSYITKAIANLCLPYLLLKASKDFLPNNISLIISPTPPITLTSVIKRIKKKHNAKFYLILRDIFPQNAVDLGLIKNDSFIHKILRKKEANLYKTADWIGCMSQGNIDYLLHFNPYIKAENVELLPNWIDTRKELKHTNSKFLKDYNIENKFVAIFGGNLGIAQKPSNIIDLAELYKENDNIVFLIIGKGIHKNLIKDLIHSKKLTNVLLLDHVPRDEFEKLACNCNVGLVSLNGNFTIPNIPSRTLGYWQASLPIFAIIDKKTDYGTNILDKYKGGLWCIEGNFKEYKEKFDLIYNNPQLSKDMGKNGLKAISEEYNVENIVNIILKHDNIH